MTPSALARPSPAAPAGLQTFARETDRKRLSEVAIKAFLNLARAWNLSNAEAAALIGVSPSSFDRMKAGARPTLGQDQMTRVSALVGIFKGLHLLFADDTADAWVRRTEQRPAVSRADADRGDDRGRHPGHARRPQIRRRRARRAVMVGRAGI